MIRTALLLGAAALLAATPRAASAQQHRFRCESNDYRQHLCRADTRGGVTLGRVLSDAACVRNRSWWVTREGVVVSNGCRGEFVVNDRYGSGGYGDWNRDRDGDWNRDRDRDWNRDRRGDDWWRRNASSLCRREVADRIGRGYGVQTWVRDQKRNSVELGWRADRYANGTCRVDDRGRVRIHVDRYERNRDRDRHRYHN